MTLRSNWLNETRRWSWDRLGLLIITRRFVLATRFYANAYR